MLAIELMLFVRNRALELAELAQNEAEYLAGFAVAAGFFKLPIGLFTHHLH